MKAGLVRVSGDFLAEALHLPKGVHVSNITSEPLKNSEFILRLEGNHPALKEVELGAIVPFVSVNYIWQDIPSIDSHKLIVKTEIK